MCVDAGAGPRDLNEPVSTLSISKQNSAYTIFRSYNPLNKTQQPEGLTMAQSNTVLSLATKLATSYVGNNKVAREELPAFIGSLHDALAKLESGEPIHEPAVPIDKSVKRNEVICLECGSGHKMLKRHISTGHGLTPEEYRERWGLARDYPLVAPNYAKQRSELAKKIGLGRKPGAAKAKKPAAKSTKLKARRKR